MRGPPPIGGRGRDITVGAPLPSMPTAYTSTSVSRTSCLTSPTPTRLLVSLPSEMITTAFLRFCPPCAIGTASATASYIAVPPFGLTRPRLQ